VIIISESLCLSLPSFGDRIRFSGFFSPASCNWFGNLLDYLFYLDNCQAEFVPSERKFFQINQATAVITK